MAATWTSPGKVVSTTPPRRTSWVPTSPSPLRNSFTTGSYSLNNEDDEDSDIDLDDDDDDDEELLQLKLRQIKAQLALKKAQKRKKLEASKTHNELDPPTIQVPHSPSPSPPPAAPAPPPVSPQRIVLGIDRGKKASQVSLKNPWKPPVNSPPKPPTTFAQRLSSVVRETKRKASADSARASKRQKTYLPATLSAQTSSTQRSDETEEWCQYTGFNLRRRMIAKGVLKEEFRGKTVFSISDLYRLIRPPGYEVPEVDTPDLLVTGVVAQKSSVRQVRGREDGGNYIVVKITDLKMDIDLFLFGEAFERTWKLQKGTVIVLLNPEVFKKKDGKGFNLRMNENKSHNNKRLKRTDSTDHDAAAADDMGGYEGVLEVGFAKDWAGCEALKADGTVCGDWVDTRHTTVCAYHVDQGLKRDRKGRMEYAVGMRAFSPKKEKETRNPFAPKKVNNKERNNKPPKTHVPDKWDGGGGSIYHSTSSTTTTTSSLPPADDPNSLRKRTEGIKRQLKGSEREREIRRSLKAFAPLRPPPVAPRQDENKPGTEEKNEMVLLEESKAFDAKRVRQIGFDPRRRANEEVGLRAADRKISPITGGGATKISLEVVLGGGGGGSAGGEREDIQDSDSDSDLDIIMAGD